MSGCFDSSVYYFGFFHIVSNSIYQVRSTPNKKRQNEMANFLIIFIIL